MISKSVAPTRVDWDYNRGPQEAFMRARVLCTIFTMISSAALAQQPAAQSPPPAKLFAGTPDVTAMIAKAKAERKPDQPNFTQPIVRSAPYSANLEYRAAGVNAPASVHEREAEMFYVVEGTGTLVTGGKLREERRTNAENLTGSGIDGGSPRRLVKGDWVMVPEKTPHWFTQIEGALVLMSIHLPLPR
jgi:mannose-6-phosphate isomerase-like protein (cupin superfamily)